MSHSAAVTREVFSDVFYQAIRFDPDGGSAQAWLLTLAHSRALDRMSSEVADSDGDDLVGAHRSRLGRVLDALARRPAGALPVRLCSAAADMLESPGVGLGRDAGEAGIRAIFSFPLQPSGDLRKLFTDDGTSPWEIHQATGMVSAQLGISIRDALAVLRGHAFSSGRSISETAGDVVAGRIQLKDAR